MARHRPRWLSFRLGTLLDLRFWNRTPLLAFVWLLAFAIGFGAGVLLFAIPLKRNVEVHPALPEHLRPVVTLLLEYRAIRF